MFSGILITIIVVCSILLIAAVVFLIHGLVSKNSRSTIVFILTCIGGAIGSIAVIVTSIVALNGEILRKREEIYKDAEYYYLTDQYQKAKECYLKLNKHGEYDEKIYDCDHYSANWYSGQGQYIKALELLMPYKDEASIDSFEQILQKLKASNDNHAFLKNNRTMLGMWLSDDGKQYLEFYEQEDDSDRITVKTSFDTASGGFYRFENGVYAKSEENEEDYRDILLCQSYLNNDRRIYVLPTQTGKIVTLNYMGTDYER